MRCVLKGYCGLAAAAAAAALFLVPAEFTVISTSLG